MRLSLFSLFALTCFALTHCSTEAPFAAGTMRANDPEATELFTEAKVRYTEGSLRKARKKLEKLVEYHPLAVEAPEALLMTGDIFLAEGEPVDAFEAYNKLITDYPSSTLYTTALQKQTDLAFGSAEGKIKYKFLWIMDTPIDTSHVVDMLTKVRDNAPTAPTAPKALLKLGETYERTSAPEQAITAYHKVVDNYPSSGEAPYAQFAVGNNLLSRMEQGSRNKSTLKAAQESFEDFLQRYPKHTLAPLAKDKLSQVRWRLATLNLDIANFYLRTGNKDSALFYFQEAAHDRYNKEVRDQALATLKELGVKPKSPYPAQEPPAPAEPIPASTPAPATEKGMEPPATPAS